MSVSLSGRTALVTGAGRGIGRAHALVLASLGAAVVVNDMGVGIDGSGEDSSVADSVVADIHDAGGRAVANIDDISSFDGAARAVSAARDAFGGVDILVNNAGIAARIARGGPVVGLTEEGLTRMLAVHLLGTVGTVRAALPSMLQQGHGRIVNTVSESALDSRHPADLAYGAAKGAVWAATLAMAREAAGTGVTVNGLSPGARTRMSAAYLDSLPEPQQIDLSPEHVARVAAVLVSDEAGDVNGEIVHAAGGVVRIYGVHRTGSTPLAQRLEAAAKSLASP